MSRKHYYNTRIISTFIQKYESRTRYTKYKKKTNNIVRPKSSVTPLIPDISTLQSSTNTLAH
uniref:Uncharacterized protein n=1 Tax=Anguilla anguilla TaxID=7936 RepID=A0A0E9XEP9_ANGAN